MKIVFTGGGTGGHFFPLIAVAEEINKQIDAQKLLDIKLYYLGDTPYDKKALFDNKINFVKTTSGKNRLYFSIKNIGDYFKILLGSMEALVKMFFIYPDVVFSKGGYASFPVVLAARILRIPVVIHESDSIPGRVNIWTGKFAKKIALSYPDAAKYFPKDKVAVTGLPIRKEMEERAVTGMNEYLKLEQGIPTLFVLGGSAGATTINDVVLDSINQLLEKYQVIHQVGSMHVKEVTEQTNVVLINKEKLNRYHIYGILNPLEMKMAAGAADIIITRAGSTLFEIASWGVPSIIIPIPENISRDQKSNAFNYARAGGGIVIEQDNLSSALLLSEIERVLQNPQKIEQMKNGARSFAKPNASKAIAEELVSIVLAHQK